MTEEPFDLDVCGGKVRGFLRQPRAGTRMAIVILHGWIGYCAGPHRILYELAEALGEAGMGTVRFDFFGRGDSDGRYEDTTFQHAVDDTCRVARYAQAQLGGCRLAMAGMCFGATVGWRCTDLWQSMVLLSPERIWRRASFSTRLTALRQHGYRIAQRMVSPRSWMRLISGRTNPSRAYRYYTKADALPYVAELPTQASGAGSSALLILGGADPAAAAVRRQYEAVGRKLGVECDTYVVPGADHSFCSVDWKHAAISWAVRWLCR
jgi:pimeloyl-ACP methyl ester carboxylesterase